MKLRSAFSMLHGEPFSFVPTALSLIPLVVYLLICLLGCYNPSDKAEGKLAKVDSVKGRQAANQAATLERVQGYVYATGAALDMEPAKTPPVKVAADMNQRAAVVAGPPPMAEAREYDTIVAGLLATNAQQHAKAEAALAAKDATVAALQAEAATLKDKLAKAETKRDEAMVEIAKQADTWVKLKRWFRWGLFGLGLLIVIPIVLKILAVFFPVAGVAASVFDMAAGGAAKAVFAVMPKAKAAAGVVASEAHRLSEDTLRQVVSALEEAKARNPEVKEALKPVLNKATTDETRLKIEAIKAGANLTPPT